MPTAEQTSTRFEIRTASVRAAAEGRQVHGYAAVFGARSLELYPGFVEIIERGAFREHLGSGADVVALMDHDPGRLLGRRSSGTLRLEEDDIGLRFELDLPDTTDGSDALVLVRRGDLRGASFRFEVQEESWDWKVDPPLRTLKRVTLDEVSLVTFPAYPATQVSSRAADQVRARRTAQLRHLRAKLRVRRART